MRAASLPSRPRKVIRWPPAKVITREPTWTATSRFRLTVAPTFRSKKFSESDGELAVSGEVGDPTPMLLNEFLKEHQKVEEQGFASQRQEATIAQLNAVVAQQQKQIEALTAIVQKVSDQIALSRP